MMLPRARSSAVRLLFFTDLDGTLLDETYSYEAALPALAALQDHGIPLVLVSSKTRAEIEALRRRLGHVHPFIAENGGAIYIPTGTFPFPVEGAIPLTDGLAVVGLGTDYAALRASLVSIRQTTGVSVRGFGDMTAAEVGRLTGLPEADAVLAKQREHDEPFLVEGSEEAERMVLEAITARGLHWTKGGRFYHLTGRSDKGVACRRLLSCYRRLHGDAVASVALGDSDNDLPMLAAVDRPILLRRPDGSHAMPDGLDRIAKADGIGPIGWNQAVLGLLRGTEPISE